MLKIDHTIVAIFSIALIEVAAIEHGMDGLVLKSSIGAIVGIIAGPPITVGIQSLTTILKRRKSNGTKKAGTNDTI